MNDKIAKIKSVATTAAGKVMRMKTSHKIIIGAATVAAAAATGYAVVKTNQAKKQERSVKSLLLEDAARRLPVSLKRDLSYDDALEESAKPFELPKAARRALGMTELDELTDTFVVEPKCKTTDIIIFYLHGSNFWFHPSRFHYAFFKKLADKTGAQLVIPIYPKAPAHNAVEIQQMLLDRYLYLVNDKEIPADKIAFAGDAAGAGLALALLQKLRYQALPLPKQAFLISPWLDLTNSDPMIDDIQPFDSILDAERLSFKAEVYADELELTHPAVSPIYGDLNGLPHITVFAGGREIFCVDAMKLQALADEQGLDIDVNIYKNQMHFFIGQPIPEAEEAMAIIVSELYGVEEVEELPDEAADTETAEDAAEGMTEEADEPAEDEVLSF